MAPRVTASLRGDPKAVQKDMELHERLSTAHANGQIDIYTNFTHLNRGGSPVFSVMDNTAPLLLLLLLGVALLFINIVAGLGTLLFSAVLYLFVIRPWIARRLHDRTVRMMMLNLHNMQVLWRFGGIVMTLVENPRAGCTAPDSDWRAIARRFVATRQGPGLGTEEAGLVAGAGGTGGSTRGRSSSARPKPAGLLDGMK